MNPQSFIYHAPTAQHARLDGQHCRLVREVPADENPEAEFAPRIVVQFASGERLIVRPMELS